MATYEPVNLKSERDINGMIKTMNSIAESTRQRQLREAQEQADRLTVEQSLEGWEDTRWAQVNTPTCPDTILDTAADVLEADGWTKGTLHKGYTLGKVGEHCALGALGRAAGIVDERARYQVFHDEYDPIDLEGPNVSPKSVAFAVAREALQTVVQGRTGKTSYIPTWNDSPLTGKEEVISTLRETARVLRTKYPRRPKKD